MTLCDNLVDVVSEDNDNDRTQNCVTVCDSPVDVVLKTLIMI